MRSMWRKRGAIYGIAALALLGVAYVATVEYSVDSPNDDRQQQLADELAARTQRRVAVFAPPEMDKDEVGRMTFVIAGDDGDLGSPEPVILNEGGSLGAPASDDGPLAEGEVEVTEHTGITLDGRGAFEIALVGTTTVQRVTPERPTTWRWNVTPLETGPRPVDVIATQHLSDDPNDTHDDLLMTATISVRDGRSGSEKVRDGLEAIDALLGVVAGIIVSTGVIVGVVWHRRKKGDTPGPSAEPARPPAAKP
jgi:hypothetical protein